MSSSSDYVDQVAGAIVAQLKAGTAPWQKPWEAGQRFMPFNPTTGNEYRGMNALWLMSQAETKGFSDARWLTYRQADAADAQVRRGEKGTAIQYWKWQGLEPVRDGDGKPVIDQDGKQLRQAVRYERPRVWAATVFNAEQIDGLALSPARPALAEWERHERAETILANSGVAIRHITGDRAFYRVSEDTITLPTTGQFATGDRYYATALHELGHATGHPARLARDMVHPFGSEGYAREELRAEIGSLMLGEQLGVGHDPAQHAAYVASWIKVLEQDPREIFRAAADAEKIAKLVRSYELIREQTVDEVAAPIIGVSSSDQSQEQATPMQDDALVPTMPVMISAQNPAMQPPSSERTYLAVPYAEKDDAKGEGAKWDAAAKAWFVPAGVPLDAFAPWLPARGSVHIAVEAGPVEQFAEALRESGLRLDGAPVMNGQMHRVSVEGDRAHERSGAYKGHLDGRPAGFIENFKAGTRTTWKAATHVGKLSAQDRAQMAADAAQKRQDRAHERELQAERTAQQMDALWTAATPAQAHPYLAAKAIEPHGLRVGAAGQSIAVRSEDEVMREMSVEGLLLVPVADETGRLASLQFIREDGRKMFAPSGRIEGGHFVVGDAARPGPLLIAEGLATAATLHELTGMPAIAAFNAGNLLSVAQLYRSLDPERVIYVAGDDDRHRAAELDAQGRPKINVGRVKAEEAAMAIGAQAIFPGFRGDNRGTDWNDLALSEGRSGTAIMLVRAMAIADREQTVGMAIARETVQERQPAPGHAPARELVRER